MEKSDHITYWTRSGDHCWDTATVLATGKRYVEALFFYCLAIEKYLKANWVLDNTDNIPPRIHDLQSIYSQTDIELTPDLIDFMDTVNRWNIEGRYPDYKFSLYKLATGPYVEKHYPTLQALKTCLLERL